MVVWFIGIAGSGKSTQAMRLYRYWRECGRRCVLIDGDDARRFFDHDLGFAREDRMANVKRILFGAYMAQAAGADCIVASISPFEELRRFARRKIPGYIEIYLRWSAFKRATPFIAPTNICSASASRSVTGSS